MIQTTWRHVMIGDHFIGGDGRSWRICEVTYLYRGWTPEHIVADWPRVAEIDPSPTLERLQITAEGPVDHPGFRQIRVTDSLLPEAPVTLSHVVYIEDGARAALFNLQAAGLFPEEIR